MTFTASTFVAAFVGGIASAVLSRVLHARRVKRLKLETLRLLRAEFIYWGEQGGDSVNDGAIVIGAQGATANVMAALMGHPAPWHIYTPPAAAEQE